MAALARSPHGPVTPDRSDCSGHAGALVVPPRRPSFLDSGRRWTARPPRLHQPGKLTNFLPRTPIHVR